MLTDHLGSLNGEINAETDSVTYYSYNAWGIARDADDWTSEYEVNYLLEEDLQDMSI